MYAIQQPCVSLLTLCWQRFVLLTAAFEIKYCGKQYGWCSGQFIRMLQVSRLLSARLVISQYVKIKVQPGVDVACK